MQLTIITINLNNAKGLEETIASVANQKKAEFEYLVIDGGSTDQSTTLLAKYQKYISAFISEKDNGVYHAMNKGIKLAKGKYLLFLNSGDTLNHQHVIADLLEYLKTNPQKDIYYTDVIFVDEMKKFAYSYQFPKQLDITYFLTHSICHQISVIRRKLFDELGYYNEGYRLVSDWAFFLKAYQKGYSYQHIDHFFLSNYLQNGISSDYITCKKERLQVIKTEYSEYLNNYLAATAPPSLWTRALQKAKIFLKISSNKNITLLENCFTQYEKQRKIDLKQLLTNV